MDTLSTGHLFAGIDGLGLGLEPHGFRTAWFSEYEDAPSRVLAHHYPDVPNHGDITAIDWAKVEPVDVLTGGFPCQDLSYAGKGAGIKEGTRSGLWFEYVRAIRALRPRIVIVENVAALLRRGLDTVLGDLASCGFDASWSVLRASDVGAAHRRERLFIVAVATDSDVRRHLHGQPGKHPAEAGVHALGHVAAGGHEDASRAAVEDTDEQPGKQRRISASGQAEGGRSRSEPAGRSRAPVADGNSDGLDREQGSSSQRGTLRTHERDNADRRGDQSASDPNGEPAGRDSGAAPRAQATDAGRGQSDHGVGPAYGDRPTDWGEFAPAIRRWERTTGRPAPAPTVDGRLSAQFVEWHMGFPDGWVDVLSRNQALKALGNAVVPQCADVIGHWALELTAQQEAA